MGIKMVKRIYWGVIYNSTVDPTYMYMYSYERNKILNGQSTVKNFVLINLL